MMPAAPVRQVTIDDGLATAAGTVIIGHRTSSR